MSPWVPKHFKCDYYYYLICFRIIFALLQGSRERGKQIKKAKRHAGEAKAKLIIKHKPQTNHLAFCVVLQVSRPCLLELQMAHLCGGGDAQPAVCWALQRVAIGGEIFSRHSRLIPWDISGKSQLAVNGPKPAGG